MKIENYMNLKQKPVYLSLIHDRTSSFRNISHYHQGVEMIYVHEGCGTILVNQMMYELTAGALYFFQPDQMHLVRVQPSPAQPYVRTMLLFEPSLLLQSLKSFPALSAFVRYLWKDPAAVQYTQLEGERRQQLETLLAICRAQQQSGPTAESAERDTLLLAMILDHVRIVWDRLAPAAAEGGHVELSDSVVKMLDWIDAHYDRTFRLLDVSEHVHLSPNHASFLFHKEIGSTLSDYLHARRMKEACLLLKSTAMPIRDIGQTVGLANFSHFCQSFKRATGYSPSAYRKL